jgi:lysyl-tRNA synthetase class 2
VTIHWQPVASIDIIRQRAELYKTIRRFMEERDIMEVHTPVLSLYGNPDPNLSSFRTLFHSPSDSGVTRYYLNTSPEFAMKRLIAAGSGSIYQICKVFRDDEAGPKHEPEFTMLEWYRVGYDHHQLMDEICELLSRFGYYDIERISYGEVFESCTGLNPHDADNDALLNKCKYYGFESSSDDRAVYLDFIFSHSVARSLASNRAVLLYDFPACQASLAKIRMDSVPVAERFELFINGLEIANGFHELCDAQEQLVRFQADNMKRKKSGLDEIPIDDRLIASLKHGLPNCAGVALGLDRIFMQMKGLNSLEEVLAFSSRGA